MTPEELMKPRYKVIDDYPFNTHCFLGEIIYLNNKNNNNPFTRYGDDAAWYEADFDYFPHLFKKLDWWEDRDKKDMPQYLKLVMDDRTQFVHKVEKWDGENYKGQPLYEYVNRVGYQTISCVSELLPATEEEYNNQ